MRDKAHGLYENDAPHKHSRPTLDLFAIGRRLVGDEKIDSGSHRMKGHGTRNQPSSDRWTKPMQTGNIEIK